MVRREDYDDRQEWLADLALESLSEGMAEAIENGITLSDCHDPAARMHAVQCLADTVTLAIVDMRTDTGGLDIALSAEDAKRLYDWLKANLEWAWGTADSASAGSEDQA